MKQGKWVSLLMTFVMTISLASCGAPSAQTTLPPETSAPVETGQPVEGNYPVTVQAVSYTHLTLPTNREV